MFFINKIEVERVNQEKRLVEFAEYITLDTSPWRATNREECDVVWPINIFALLHASYLNF